MRRLALSHAPTCWQAATASSSLVVTRRMVASTAPSSPSSSSLSASSSHQSLIRDEFTRQSSYIERAGGGTLSTRTAWYTNASWFIQSAFRHHVLAPYHRHAVPSLSSSSLPSSSSSLAPLRVLEVAAGTGILSRTLATDINMSDHARGRVTIIGVDLTPAMLEQGRQAATHAGINEQQLRLVEGNALALPFDDNSFDVVMTRWFLHHVPADDVAAAMKEMARVTKHGGVVFNMDNETLGDEVLHKRMNDIERLRDPSHTHFPLPYQFDEGFANAGLDASMRMERGETRSIQSWLDLTNTRHDTRKQIMTHFQRHTDYVRDARKQALLADPNSYSLSYRPFARSYTNDERQHLSGFNLDVSTRVPESFTSRCVFTAFVKPPATNRTALGL